MERNKLFLMGVLFSLLSLVSSAKAQMIFTCEIDGDEFIGTVNDAVLVDLGEEEYLQIHAMFDKKVLYLYLKTALFKNPVPLTLVYRQHNHETGETPDAESIWAPDGADGPQWNTIEGEAVITAVDESTKTISGNFEFVVEKASYSSRPDKKNPTIDIREGKFVNIQYRLEEKKSDGNSNL
ncbi:MAG: hypothetical protein AB1521_16765 [Bacteroidota bacterium]